MMTYQNGTCTVFMPFDKYLKHYSTQAIGPVNVLQINHKATKLHVNLLSTSHYNLHGSTN